MYAKTRSSRTGRPSGESRKVNSAPPHHRGGSLPPSRLGRLSQSSAPALARNSTANVTGVAEMTDAEMDSRRQRRYVNETNRSREQQRDRGTVVSKRDYYDDGSDDNSDAQSIISYGPSSPTSDVTSVQRKSATTTSSSNGTRQRRRTRADSNRQAAPPECATVTVQLLRDLLTRFLNSWPGVTLVVALGLSLVAAVAVEYIRPWLLTGSGASSSSQTTSNSGDGRTRADNTEGDRSQSLFEIVDDYNNNHSDILTMVSGVFQYMLEKMMLDHSPSAGVY